LIAARHWERISAARRALTSGLDMPTASMKSVGVILTALAVINPGTQGDKVRPDFQSG
jgi:uncharacterized membrane protein YdfJ with MMPL/SSD domain